MIDEFPLLKAPAIKSFDVCSGGKLGNLALWKRSRAIQIARQIAYGGNTLNLTRRRTKTVRI